MEYAIYTRPSLVVSVVLVYREVAPRGNVDCTTYYLPFHRLLYGLWDPLKSLKQACTNLVIKA
jgi:hypothetical protein